MRKSLVSLLILSTLTKSYGFIPTTKNPSFVTKKEFRGFASKQSYPESVFDDFTRRICKDYDPIDLEHSNTCSGKVASLVQDVIGQKMAEALREKTSIEFYEYASAKWRGNEVKEKVQISLKKFLCMLGVDNIDHKNIIHDPDTSAHVLESVLRVLGKDKQNPTILYPKSAFRRLDNASMRSGYNTAHADITTPEGLEIAYEKEKAKGNNITSFMIETPNVPFGKILSQEEIDSLADNARELGIHMIIDIYLMGTQSPDIDVLLPSNRDSVSIMFSTRRTLASDMMFPSGGIIFSNENPRLKEDVERDHDSLFTHYRSINADTLDGVISHPDIDRALCEHREELFYNRNEALRIIKEIDGIEAISDPPDAGPFMIAKLTKEKEECLINLGFGNDKNELDYYKLLEAVCDKVLFTPLAHFHGEDIGFRFNTESSDNVISGLEEIVKKIDKIINYKIKYSYLPEENRIM